VNGGRLVSYANEIQGPESSHSARLEVVEVNEHLGVRGAHWVYTLDAVRGNKP
jgi:hypothetical protein